MNRELLNRAELLIMYQNDYRGTRDFILIDTETETFYIGSTHSMSLDVRATIDQTLVKTKRALKIEKEYLLERGYKMKHAREL